MAEISRVLEILNHEIVWKEALLKNKEKECDELRNNNKALEAQVNSLLAENIALKALAEGSIEIGNRDNE